MPRSDWQTACDLVLDGELVGSALHEGGGEQHASISRGLGGREPTRPSRRPTWATKNGGNPECTVTLWSLPQRIPAELSL